MKKNDSYSRVGVILFFFMLKSVVSAQEVYLPGYIITMNDDTIHGEIRKRAPYYNSHACFFRESENEKAKEYLPFDIKAYRILGGRYYISRMAPLNDGKEPLFLEFLVKGEANLYVYRDGEKDNYLIERKGYPLVMLKNEKKLVRRTEGVYASYTKEYVGVLKYVFSDYKSLYPEINSLELNDKNLVKFAEDFHAQACEGEKCIVFERKLEREKMKFRVAVAGGMNVGMLAYRGKSEEPEQPLSYDPSVSFYPALQLNLYFTQREKTGLVLYGAWIHDYFYGSTGKEATGYFKESLISVSSARLALWFKYTYITRKMRPFLFAGYMVNFSFNQSTRSILDRFSFNSVVTYYIPEEESVIPANNHGPVGGIGLEYPLAHFIPFMQIYAGYLGFTFTGDKMFTSNISTGFRLGISF